MDDVRSETDVGGFYDDYVERQLAVGVNDRHRAILRWLRRFGLRAGHRVLEIGCGVGTVTQLIAKELGPRGSLLAVDLSPRSIEVATARLAGFANVRLLAGDVLETEITGPFDAVVLPDVIEHIPLEMHGALFSRVAAWLAPGGFVLLHYPNPYHLEWCQVHRPEELQIIDQPIYADRLLANAYPHGLALDFMQTYSIWIRDGDYTVAVLRPKPTAWDPTPIPEPRRSLTSRIAGRVRRLTA
jgi:trans-aconitate 2-methyltransferase